MKERDRERLIAECNAAIAAGTTLNRHIDFYSKGCAGLVVTLSHGRIIKEEGKGERRTGEIHAEFHRVNSLVNADKSAVKFGMYSTNNPVAVLALLQRAEEKGDVVDADTFLELTTPKDILVNQARERTVAVENELAAWVEKAKQQEAELEQLRKAAAAQPAPSAKPAAQASK